MQQVFDRGNGFADLVHAVLVLDGKWDLREVARQMGMKYDTLYARIRNGKRTPFSADEIRALIAAAPDVRLVNYFLDGSAFIAADRNSGPVSEEQRQTTILAGAADAVIEASDVLEEVRKSLEDGKLDHRERIRIRTEIENAERALATLRTYIGPCHR